MYKHILIPTDGSELSQRAVRQGIDLAQSMNARVTLVTSSIPYHLLATAPMMVNDRPRKYAADVERRAASRLKEGEEYAGKKGVAATAKHVFAVHPFLAIIDAAQSDGCDLVCMASHGRKGVAGLLIGSETSKVLTHSKVPVLVLR